MVQKKFIFIHNDEVFKYVEVKIKLFTSLSLKDKHFWLYEMGFDEKQMICSVTDRFIMHSEKMYAV